ncbi:MAG TPA: proline dehydrogenase family protein [Prolixibacteraceae bacterium]|nr:proline dehydrogenase family protein [Prolixibacteraceae bacterium]
MLNKIIADTLPYLPKKLVWMFSKKYVAGEHIEEGISISRELNRQGMLVTVDLLGEFITNLDEARKNKEEYRTIIQRFSDDNIRGNFSVKPTSFGLLIDPEECYRLTREVVDMAARRKSFVRIDMEDSQCTRLEIDLFKRLLTEYPHNVGLVLQAYLKRTRADIEELADFAEKKGCPLNIRLCKGIYVEPEEIAWRDFHQVRHHYLKDLELLFQRNAYVGIATHDSFLVSEAQSIIHEQHRSNDSYEFQMLYGVTPSLRDSIVTAGHSMRIYVPFGKDWFGYCSRRLKENPKMVYDILKAIFIRG